MKRMLTVKVFASYLILIFLTIAVLDFFLTPRIKAMMEKGIEDEMFGIAGIITLMPQNTLPGKVVIIDKRFNVRVTIIDPAGKVVADSEAPVTAMDNHLSRPEIKQARAEGRGKASRFSTTLKESMLYVALPITENGQNEGYIRLARPLTKVGESLDHLYNALYLTMVIIGLPSLILAIVFSRKIVSGNSEQ